MELLIPDKKWDTTLRRIMRETAVEYGIPYRHVRRIFNHYYKYVFTRAVSMKYSRMGPRARRDNAENIKMPVFGKFICKYGIVDGKYSKRPIIARYKATGSVGKDKNFTNITDEEYEKVSKRKVYTFARKN